jgi:membrane-associated protein
VIHALASTMPAAGGILDPNWWFDHYGTQFFLIACLIVFVECGLFFPFLPGDSLLFAVGMFIALGKLPENIALAVAGLAVSAFLGNVVGYELGRLIGPKVFDRDGRIIKRKYLEQTHAFFERHGSKALVIGRFVPIVRTFVTVVAGVGQMERRRFFTWSAVGAVLWVVLVTLAGYFLGKSFPGLGKNIDYAIVVIVVLSLLPMVYEYLKHRRQANAAAGEVLDEVVEELRD